VTVTQKHVVCTEHNGMSLLTLNQGMPTNHTLITTIISAAITSQPHSLFI